MRRPGSACVPVPANATDRTPHGTAGSRITAVMDFVAALDEGRDRVGVYTFDAASPAGVQSRTEVEQAAAPSLGFVSKLGEVEEVVRDLAHRILSQKLRGHFGYYGITGNAKCLAVFSQWVHGIWRKWLDRRSQRARMTWERFERLLERYPLPPPRAVHSEYRYAANP